MRQAPRSPLSFKLQRVANVPEHPPPSTRLMSCAHIANRQLSRIIGARSSARFLASLSPEMTIAGIDDIPSDLAASSRCPYRKPKPKQLTDARESVDSPIDERSLQIDLVRLDRAVPAAGRAGSRNPCSSTPATYPAAQMPETSGPQQHRPAAACWALLAGSRGAGRSEDYKAEDADTLAPRRLSSLLALEIATARRSASDTCGHLPPH